MQFLVGMGVSWSLGTTSCETSWQDSVVGLTSTLCEDRGRLRLEQGEHQLSPSRHSCSELGQSHPAAFDVTVTSPLTPAILKISSVYEGAAGRVDEARKHTTNDAKCQDLG